MDQSNKLQLADIEASYKTILQSEAAAGSLYQQSVRNISDILQNPDLTPEAKTAAVTNQNTMLKTGLNILGKIGGLNFDGLLDF
jgi:gamma-glutamylcysteine synthetase